MFFATLRWRCIILITYPPNTSHIINWPQRRGMGCVYCDMKVCSPFYVTGFEVSLCRSYRSPAAISRHISRYRNLQYKDKSTCLLIGIPILVKHHLYIEPHRTRTSSSLGLLKSRQGAKASAGDAVARQVNRIHLWCVFVEEWYILYTF